MSENKNYQKSIISNSTLTNQRNLQLLIDDQSDEKIK